MSSAMSLHHFRTQRRKRSESLLLQPHTAFLWLLATSIKWSLLKYCLQVSSSWPQHTRVDVGCFALCSSWRARISNTMGSFMHSYFLLFHVSIFVGFCSAKLLKRVLYTLVHKQIFSSFDVSQSEHLQHLLLSVVSSRPRGCPTGRYICLLRAQTSTFSAFFIDRQMPRVVKVFHCKKK